MCIACRKVKSKRELLRIVRTAAGELMIDGTGKIAGRGAYLCRSINCWREAFAKHKAANALKVVISAEKGEELLKAAEAEILKEQSILP
jgi:uncharacterized protein